ncbi:MAG: OmpA family protein [Elusimicrobia bacterium]|nr:OmpA family protein [Elusimicrobiota bacterium]
MAIKRAAEGDFESELNKGALWAVTYGDLMSYLMIFFLIMFAFSMGKKGPGFEPRRVEDSLANIQKVFGGKTDPAYQRRLEQRKKEDEVAASLAEQIKDKQLENVVEIKANAERVQLVLKDAVLFDSGHAELKPQALTTLETIAHELKDLPNDVMVGGHTDNVPICGGKYGSNYELSMARAYSVVKFLLAQGLDAKHLSGTGYGEHRPAGDNATPEGRAKNRRIEIELIRLR